MGRRPRRTLYITPEDKDPPRECQVYRVYDGDDLLFERRGTPEEIAELRQRCEPMREGWRATLGSGKASDPEVSNGPPPTGDVAEARRAADWHKMHMRAAEDQLEFAKFQREFLVDNLAAIAAAGEKEAAKWRALMASREAENRRPLVDTKALQEFFTGAAPVVAEVFRQFRNFKGNNGNGG